MRTPAAARSPVKPRRGFAAAVGHALLLGIVAFWLVYLLAPIVVTFAISLTSAEYTVLPPPGLSLRWYRHVLGFSWFTGSLLVSAVVATAATVASIGMGLVGALLLARRSFRGRALLEYAMLSPLIIPGVVIGFALLNAALMVGLQDSALLNLVLGHAVVTVPFSLRSIWSSLVGFDRRLEEAAQSLGATAVQTFWRVTLPGILPGIVAGAIIAFTFSFNDITVAIFLVGSTVRTLPVELMSQMEYLPDPTPAAASSIVMLLTLAFFVLIERTIGLDVFGGR
ncbi:MAG TPA: ABC transporter permease [Xanthobacteraceae bacterium]